MTITRIHDAHCRLCRAHGNHFNLGGEIILCAACIEETAHKTRGLMTPAEHGAWSPREAEYHTRRDER